RIDAGPRVALSPRLRPRPCSVYPSFSTCRRSRCTSPASLSSLPGRAGASPCSRRATNPGSRRAAGSPGSVGRPSLRRTLPMEPVIYFKGDFRPEHEAIISVRSRGLNYGLGCFAGIRGYRSDDGSQLNLFRLDRHVRRLEAGAHILCLRLPGTVEEVSNIIIELLRRNGVRDDVYVRPIVFANSNELSPLLDPDTSETAIFCMPLGRYLSSEPLHVCGASWRRVRENALPARAKATGGYLNSALARREAIDHGYTEAILLTEDGHVSEGSAEHVFIVRDGQLISPPSTEDNLDGITRQSLITLAT